MHTKIERTPTGQWNILVNGQLIEGGFFSRAKARAAAIKMRNGGAMPTETERDEIQIAGGPDYDTRDHEGMDEPTTLTSEPDAIVAPVASVPVAKPSYVLKVADGYLRRDQPRKPGDVACYRVVKIDQASVYKTLRQAQVKLLEVASLHPGDLLTELEEVL